MADSLGEGYDDDAAAGGGGTLMSKLGVMMRSEEMRDISSGVSSGVSSLLASTRLATNMVGGTTNLSTNLGGARSMLASAQRGAGAALPPQPPTPTQPPTPHIHPSTTHPPPHPPRSAFLGPSHAGWRAGGVPVACRCAGGCASAWWVSPGWGGGGVHPCALRAYPRDSHPALARSGGRRHLFIRHGCHADAAAAVSGCPALPARARGWSA